MKIPVMLLLVVLWAASTTAANKPCSGTTNFTCPPYRTSGSEETCAYDIEAINVDVVIDSSKPQSVQFYSGRKEKFTLWIRPDTTCDQPAACKNHPFQHDFDGSDKEATRFDTGHPQNHAAGTMCQYQVSTKKRFEGWSDPVLLVVK